MSDLHQRYTRFRPVSDFGPAHMTPAADGGYVNYGDLREALAVQEAIHADAELVLYADHVAAVAEAEQRRHHDPGTRCDGCHSFGFEEGVQAARDAVAAKRSDFAYATDTQDGHILLRIYDDALAAIDALSE